MAMNATPAGEGDPVSEINITPLIDVMLVLLVMLIVILPPQAQVTKLDTPVPSRTPPPDTAPPPLVHIAVDFDGAFSWNGAVIGRAELDQRLKALLHSGPLPEIHIEPHRLARYAYVVHVMAAAQREGLTRLGVVGGT